MSKKKKNTFFISKNSSPMLYRNLLYIIGLFWTYSKLLLIRSPVHMVAAIRYLNSLRKKNIKSGLSICFPETNCIEKYHICYQPVISIWIRDFARVGSGSGSTFQAKVGSGSEFLKLKSATLIPEALSDAPSIQLI